jgi:hypothetical protein
MNILNPLTLLLIPLLGALLIAFYPINAGINNSLNFEKTVYSIPFLNQDLSKKKTTFFSSSSISTNNINKTEQVLASLQIVDQNQSTLKKIAILTSLINFIVSICLWIQFDPNYIGYQFTTSLIGTSLGSLEFMQFNLGIDGISLFFVLLTTFITPIALLSSHRDIEKNLKFYLVSILLLETLQIAVFVVLDLLLFYIFFESVLIPLFFIVGV